MGEFVCSDTNSPIFLSCLKLYGGDYVPRSVYIAAYMPNMAM